MTKPTNKSKQRRIDIIEASQELFNSKGFQETSINDIMRRVGAAKGVFYYHFETKDQVLETLIEQQITNIVESVVRILDLISIGIIAVSGLLAFDLITWLMAVSGSREGMIRLYDAITQSSGFSLPFLIIGLLILVIGLLMLAVILFISKVVKKWQSLCFGVGIFLYGFAGPVFPVSNGTYFVISGAFLMLISLGMIGISMIAIKGSKNTI